MNVEKVLIVDERSCQRTKNNSKRIDVPQTTEEGQNGGNVADAGLKDHSNAERTNF